MKKILWLSNSSLANTGFGKATKEILKRLYKTGKYEICELAGGMSDADPNITRTPWRTIGVLPRNEAEAYRFNQADEGMKRAFGYGLFRFDEAVFDFKPDVVVCLEDIWAWSGWLKNIKAWGKISGRCVAAHPFDAEPLTEDFALFLKDFKYIVTYCEWSKEIANKAGLQQTQVIPLGVDTNIFLPLKNRKLLRLKHGIMDDDYVVLMVARNQVRKKFDALFESLLHIKGMNEDLFKHIRILPFTYWKDVAGFDFEKFFRSRGIPAEKVIVPYHCNVCRQYHIWNKYEGEQRDCPFCKSQKSCHTPSVISGLDDSQLNEVYNISDLFVLPTSNEGMGMPQIEAKAAGKVTIATGYSACNEVAIGYDSGFTFDHSLFIEYGTLFYKAHVSSADIAKKIAKAYRLRNEQKTKMETSARKLSLDKYSWDVIASQWETYLDGISVEPVDWEVKEKIKNPNPNAVIPESKTDVEWLCLLYKLILDADVVEESHGEPLKNQGVQYWLWELAQRKRPKEDIEAFFRQTAKDELAKKPVDILTYIDQSDPKKLLFVIPQSAGDNFLCTAVVDSLKKRYSDYAIYVAVKPEFADIWKNNPNIKKTIPFADFMMGYAWGLPRFDKGLFDIVLTPTVLTQTPPPNWSHGCKTKSFILDTPIQKD